jgi:hypothetical protein
MDDRKRFTAESALPACRRRAQVADFIRSERTHLVFVDRLNPDGTGRTCCEDHLAS